ncbi:MAG TPA: SusC/RagA family TonB-linked outer membrane protein [Chitinophagaceae bacterium]|jgi:TonB-linked SusC/RagA family outer membrane protein
MKLTTIILFAALMQVSAATMAQRVTMQQKQASLKEIFDQINLQTSYNVIYNASLVNANREVSVDFNNTPLLEALDKCLENTNLTYTIENKTVVVRQKDPSIIDKIKNAIGVATTVTASVHNELGEPMPGVTVREKGTNNTTITDNKGNFSITVPDYKTQITFTYIGYEPQELRASDIPNGSAITLKVSENNLKEVIINKGYYDEKRALSTGDVSIVSAKTIGEQPVSDPILALEGRVPGLNIQQTSGMPGAYASIQIRGQNSIANGNDPLYIVDGVPFSSLSLSSTSAPFGPVGIPTSNTFNTAAGLSPFNGLNPSDIESIEVLKDADATAIYGSRGANGVILITTKRGKAGDTRVDFNVFSGVGTVERRLDMLNTQQYLQLRREAFQNDGLAVPSIATNPSNTDYDINGVWDTTRYTDWQKVFLGNTSHFTNAQGDISGGNANTQFVFGVGYSDQGNVFPGNFTDQKGSAHVNLTHTSTNGRFNAQFTANYVNDNNNMPSANMAGYITLAPDAPALYDTAGNPNWQINNGSSTFNGNPIASLLKAALSVTNNLVSNLHLSYTILPDLMIKSGFGYSHDEINQTLITPSSSIAPPYNTYTTSRNLQFATNDFSSWIIEPQISYKRMIGKGKLDALVGSSFQENKTNAITENGTGFVSDALIRDPQNASSISIYGANNSLYHYMAFYGRVSYSWLDKYVINLTGRRDGSSRFGPGKQFGNFGAVGAGWIFSNEHFIENCLPWLSFGKLRGSYGTSGNDQIGDYQFLSTYRSNYQSYQGVNGLSPTSLTNPFFAWEVVKKLEGGIELGLLKDRINLSIDYYRNRTGNQLVGLPLPNLTGFSSVQYNLPAVVQNSGLEFTINTVNIKTKDFEWTTNINGTLPRNKLVSFPNISNFGAYQYTYVVGKSLFINEVYRSAGVNPQTGLYTFYSKEPGGPDFQQDLVVTKPVTQYFYGGIGNKISYKGISLDFFIQYVNQYVRSWINAFSSPPGYRNSNQLTTVFDRWKQPGDLASVQRAGRGIAVFEALNTEKSSDAAYAGASFLRLKNLSVSYQIPSQWIAKLHWQSARIYVQGQNLFTVTNYLGLDPETAGTLVVPPIRMVTAGFQVGL